MSKKHILLCCNRALLAVAITSLSVGVVSGLQAERPLLDSVISGEQSLSPEFGARVETVTHEGEQGVQVTFPQGSGYPGVNFPAPDGLINLSDYSGIELDLLNTGSANLEVVLRVENPGNWQDSPWNVQNLRLRAGESGKLRMVFGESYGKQAFKLNPAQIKGIKLFAVNPAGEGKVLIKGARAFSGSPQSGTATGSTNFNTPSIEGDLFPLNEDADLSALRTNQSSVSLAEHEGKTVLQANFQHADYPNVVFPCPREGWNMEAYRGIEVTLTNTGSEPVRAGLRVDNPGNWQDSPWNTQLSRVGAGETITLQLVFGENNGARAYPLDPTKVTGIQVFLEKPRGQSSFLIRDLKGFGSPDSTVQVREVFSTPEDRNKSVTRPDWVGQRPPVEGDWVVTLDENFEGDAVNEELWTPRLVWGGPPSGSLYRYTSDNLIVEDGILSIKSDYNPGHLYDDPTTDRRDYASGVITTLDKWSQKYGYIEARVKLPTARGLWPAFWTMPDRGAETGLDIWARRDTGAQNGLGMEIDIMEHLTEWEPGRMNVAAHWDGYGSGHKAWGSSHVYYGPTDDGWHVFGLLWEPGKLTWYIDGVKKEEFKNERVTDVPAYLKLNLQMGGWATNDINRENLPDYFKVDYVRAWQLQERL